MEDPSSKQQDDKQQVQVTTSIAEDVLSEIQELPSNDDYGTKLRIAQAASERSEPGAYHQASAARFRHPRNDEPNASRATPAGLLSQRSSLVEADLVSNRDLEEAQPVEKVAPKPTPVWIPALAVGGVLFLGVVIVSVVVLVVTQRESTPGTIRIPNVQPEPIVEISPHDFLFDILPQNLRQNLLRSSSNASTTSTTTSPQQSALDWLANDPNLRTNYTTDRLLQRYALATFYFATGGPQWTQNTGWLDYQIHECQWYGGEQLFTWAGPFFSTSPCHPETQHYERLWLSFNSLQGRLPPEIYALTSLQSIDFVANIHLVASVEPQIQQWTNLTLYSMIGVSLVGTLPTEIGLLSQLKILYLGPPDLLQAERLQGTIPTEFWQLTQLEQFTLHHNRFTGTLPSELGRMSNLTALGLQGNWLTGSIPSEMGLLTRLQYSYLYENQITGTIPTEIGRLKDLIGLHWYGNRLSGSIPSELRQATALKELLLANNTLTGTIPSELYQLNHLVMLFLSYNPQLTGSLFPSDYYDTNNSTNQSLASLEAWDIFETGISIPTSLFKNSTMSFYRYLYECRKQYPCPEDRPEGSSNSDYEAPNIDDEEGQDEN